MIRVNVVAEGQSEMIFAKKLLNIYFGGKVIVDSRCVLTSRDQKTNYEYRGCLLKYQKARDDIVRWLKEDSGAYVTTMFDYFRLPKDFPGYESAMKCQEHSERVLVLENALRYDILSEPGIVNAKERFIPYIQLHEFEALLFTDIRVLKYDYLEREDAVKIDYLYEETKMIPPEEINHGEETAPSKRLLKTVNYKKGEMATEWLEVIGMTKIREKCPHFSQWIERLYSLTNESQGNHC